MPFSLATLVSNLSNGIKRATIIFNLTMSQRSSQIYINASYDTSRLQTYLSGRHVAQHIHGSAFVAFNLDSMFQ